MTNKEKHFFKKAKEEALKSTFFRIKIGCIIVKGSKILGRGVNIEKSHPKQKYLNKKYRGFNTKESNIHAEMNALMKCKHINIKGATIYIYRELKDGSLGNCFPCPACQRRIITAGIKRIVYTDYDGIYELKIRRLVNARLQNKTKI